MRRFVHQSRQEIPFTTVPAFTKHDIRRFFDNPVYGQEISTINSIENTFELVADSQVKINTIPNATLITSENFAQLNVDYDPEVINVNVIDLNTNLKSVDDNYFVGLQKMLNYYPYIRFEHSTNDGLSSFFEELR